MPKTPEELLSELGTIPARGERKIITALKMTRELIARSTGLEPETYRDSTLTTLEQIVENIQRYRAAADTVAVRQRSRTSKLQELYRALSEPLNQLFDELREQEIRTARREVAELALPVGPSRPYIPSDYGTSSDYLSAPHVRVRDDPSESNDNIRPPIARVLAAETSPIPHLPDTQESRVRHPTISFHGKQEDFASIQHANLQLFQSSPELTKLHQLVCNTPLIGSGRYENITLSHKDIKRATGIQGSVTELIRMYNDVLRQIGFKVRLDSK